MMIIVVLDTTYNNEVAATRSDPSTRSEVRARRMTPGGSTVRHPAQHPRTGLLLKSCS